MLHCGDCRIMIDQSINQNPAAPHQTLLYLYPYPENIRQYHAQGRNNGLTVPDLELTFYGLTEFRIADPDGNRLWIGPAVPGPQP